MDKVADYLRRAVEAERQAAQATDAKERQQFIALAKTWRELAQSAGGTGRA
jgi:hypothetical protein